MSYFDGLTPTYHIFERCRLTGEYFTGEAMTGAYVAALAALYEKLDHEDRLD